MARTGHIGTRRRFTKPGTYTPVASVLLTPSNFSLVSNSTQQLIATPKDSGGNALTNRVVNWSSSNASIATVNAQGFVTGFSGGNCTITATCEGRLATAAASVAVSATQLVFTQQPTNVPAGLAITPAPRVEARDGSNNLVTNFASLVTMALGSAPGGAVLGGTVTVAAVNGVASFPNLTLNVAASGYTLVASSTGLTGATSNLFTVSTTTLLFADSFNTTPFVGTSPYFEFDTGGGLFTWQATGGRDNGPCLKAHYNLGTVAAGELHVAFGKTPQAYMRPVDAGVNIYREMYWRFWIKYQAGWTGGIGEKVTRALAFCSLTNFNSYLYGHCWGINSTTTQLGQDPASGVSAITGLLQTTTYNDFANLRFLGSLQEVPSFPFDGAWHAIECHIKLNDPGLANGLFETWIDDVLRIQQTGLNWVSTILSGGNYPAVEVQNFGINAMYLENFWNAGSPVAQDRFIDDLVISTSRIGSGAISSVVPWLLEDFSTYTSKANWLADPRGIYSVAEDNPAGLPNATFETAVGVTIDGYNLTKSVRYDYPAPGCTSQTLERDLVFPSHVGEIWFELYCKWSTNFTTQNVNGCPTPPDFKMFFLRSDAGLGRGAIRWGSQTPPVISVEILGAVDILTGVPISTYSNNQWHRIRGHWKIAGAASLIHVDIDGTQIYHNAALNAGSSTPSFYGASFARNLDQGVPTGTMSQWWGRLAFFVTDPGWGF